MQKILLLSVGTRDKIVQYFKKSFGEEGKIIAADASIYAPAIYEADKFYKVPSINSKNYLNTILNICEQEKITAVLSLIDPELSIISKNVDAFSSLGVTIIGSPFSVCELCLNKWQMYNWLISHGYKCAKTYITKESFVSDYKLGKISFPVFVKPISGSASLSTLKVNDMNTIDFLFCHKKGLLIQEYLGDKEIGADVYVDFISRKPVSVFTKKKLLMKAGETDKAISFKDNKLFKLLKKFVLELGLIGQADIDLFEINGEYFFSEVNPRFGGGYPFAHECGCNNVDLIKNNLNGIANVEIIGNYDSDVLMMKFSEIMIKKL